MPKLISLLYPQDINIYRCELSAFEGKEKALFIIFKALVFGYKY